MSYYYCSYNLIDFEKLLFRNSCFFHVNVRLLFMLTHQPVIELIILFLGGHLNLAQILELVDPLSVDRPGRGEQLLETGLAEWSGVRQILLVRRGLAAGQIIEIWRAAGVEAVAEVLEEGTAGGAEISFELIDILCAILDLLATHLGQHRGNLCHGMWLGTGDVVEFVSVPLRTLLEANRRHLSHVVRADVRVLAITDRGSKKSLLFDVLDLILHQMVHVKIATDGGHRQAFVDQTLLTPPVVLEHQRNDLAVHGGVNVLVVSVRVGVCTETGNPHHVLDLILVVCAEVFGEFKMLRDQRVHATGEDVRDAIGSRAPGRLILEIKLHNLMRADALQEIRFRQIAGGGADVEFAAFVEEGDDGFSNTAAGSGNQNGGVGHLEIILFQQF